MRLSRESVRVFLGVVFLCTLAFSAGAFAAVDRISGLIDSSQPMSLQGNVSGRAKPQFDQGRADSSKLMSGVSIVFKPSANQQADLDQLLADQQNPSSAHYHKWLTPAQFGKRFGMSQGDIDKVVAWLESEGFTVTGVANGRNLISFRGTVGQIEAVFHTEIHNYLVGGEMHYANATEPSVPAALADVVLGFQHLHNFHPRPRAQVRKVDSHFSSSVSGSHFLSPGDFATIYDVKGLYAAGTTGTGQMIAIIGQTTVNLTDLSNFRSAAGLAAKAPTMTLVPSTGTGTRCSGDEGESDLDLEWSGGVAQNANIIFVYVGILSGETCTNRTKSVWDALQYAIDNKVAPVISTSYGFCESGLGSAFANQVRGWVQQGNSQGQTIMAASGDAGAADCDNSGSTSATGGFAVDVPAAIPEVTGGGGTEFFGDSTSGADAPYWAGTTGSTDTISSALEYIPEEGWNDTTFELAHSGGISASGGGASIYFAKPTWQTGTGVPADGKRDVPDIALNASADHDGYLFCSEDGPNNTIVATCSSGFRDSNQNLAVVGGTSAVAPTFAAIVALINQDLGNSPPAGLGNINPKLYELAASNAAAFNDVTTGNNIVPCTQGSTSCPPSAPFQYGFSAGTGYDQVTGLGSVNASTLAQAWSASLTSFTLAATPSMATVVAGQNVTSTLTLTPVSGFSGAVTYTCSTGVTCTFSPVSPTTATTVTVMVQPAANTAAGAMTVTITGKSGGVSSTATVALTVTATIEAFTIAPTTGSVSVAAGSAANVSIAVSSTSTPNFLSTSGGNTTTALPLTYTCSGLPLEATCTFSPASTSSNASITLSVATTAPTARLQRPNDHRSRIFYAALLPGFFGIVFAGGSRTKSARAMRLLSLIVILGFSTIWLSSCGGSSSSNNSNPGTPAGTSTVTVNATTGGANPVANSFTFKLVVTN
jgi:subtilase family serine protease